jgi:hypothetical protein
MQVSQRNRIIEPEFRTQRGTNFGGHVGICRELAERVAGSERQDLKQYDADAEQTRDRDEQPP